MSGKSDALRLLNVIEQEATRASDKGEWLNAPWTVSLIREIRTALNGEAAAATEPRTDPALDEARRLTVEQISGELSHYDLSTDPGYVTVPTERIRAIFRAALDGEETRA